jgi:polysaccharide export outer membrane protein
MKLKTIIVLLLCAVCASAIPLVGQQPAPAQAERPPAGAYVIQPNDLLSIFVFSHPELSRERVVVQPDGLISTPLVQSIQAAGLTPAQLKVALEKRITDGKLIDVPAVTVTLEGIQSYRIFLIGKVQKPGMLNYEKPLTVLQALAMAGGFQDYAKKKDITIIRSGAFQTGTTQKEKRFNFNYEEAVGKDPKSDQNIYLESGDVVDIH